jgi:hypothetical protein
VLFEQRLNLAFEEREVPRYININYERLGLCVHRACHRRTSDLETKSIAHSVPFLAKVGNISGELVFELIQKSIYTPPDLGGV